jgi:hypothetical protein
MSVIYHSNFWKTTFVFQPLCKRLILSIKHMFLNTNTNTFLLQIYKILPSPVLLPVCCPPYGLVARIPVRLSCIKRCVFINVSLPTKKCYIRLLYNAFCERVCIFVRFILRRRKNFIVSGWFTSGEVRAKSDTFIYKSNSEQFRLQKNARTHTRTDDIKTLRATRLSVTFKRSVFSLPQLLFTIWECYE